MKASMSLREVIHILNELLSFTKVDVSVDNKKVESIDSTVSEQCKLINEFIRFNFKTSFKEIQINSEKLSITEHDTELIPLENKFSFKTKWNFENFKIINLIYDDILIETFEIDFYLPRYLERVERLLGLYKNFY